MRSIAISFLVLVSCGARSEPLSASIDDATDDATTFEAGKKSTRCPNDADETTIASIDTEYAQGTAIAVRDGEVYFATRAGKDDSLGVVAKVSRCGGATTTLAADLQGPAAIATDGTRVFFGTIGGGATRGSLQSVPANGGPTTTIATSAVYEGQLAIDAHDLYWTTYATSSGVWKMSLAGGAPTPIGPDQIFQFIAVDATRAFLSQPASIPANSKLVSMSIDGGPLTTLVPADLDFPGVLAIDEANVYCVIDDRNLVELSKDGGAPVVLAHAEINAMAVDDANVYWAQGDATTGTPGGIERVSKSGGAKTEISKSYGDAIAIDDLYVYWLRGGDVVRSRK